MAGDYPLSQWEIFSLGASESAFQCNLSDQLKNFSHRGGTFIYLYICFIFYHKSAVIIEQNGSETNTSTINLFPFLANHFV